MIGVIDLPREGEIAERMSIRFRGWVIVPVERRAAFAAVVVRAGGREIARRRQLDFRADVIAAHGLPSDLRTGFDFLFDLRNEAPGSTLALELWAEFSDGPPVLVAARRIELSREDYARGHFAPLLAPGETDILHRRHIYTAGPSSPEPSPECLASVLECLGPGAGRSMLDLGCGVGAYALPMQAAGFRWTGLEVNSADCAILRTNSLPHVQGDGRTLPFPDRSWDVVMAVEVLEHVEDPAGLLAEVARVAPEAVISVPNCELIPYLSRLLAVPWHILESTHMNFFSRWTLENLLRAHFREVRLRAYGPAPVRSVDGAPLYYHLLAHVRR